MQAQGKQNRLRLLHELFRLSDMVGVVDQGINMATRGPQIGACDTGDGRG